MKKILLISVVLLACARPGIAGPSFGSIAFPSNINLDSLESGQKHEMSVSRASTAAPKSRLAAMRRSKAKLNPTIDRRITAR